MSSLGENGEKSDALSSAAIAALAGALAYGLKKALADRHPPSLQSTGERAFDRSLLPAALESTPDMLVPLFENAASAAGKWVAENSPDLIRERLLPRFIGAFTDAAKMPR
jgi:hypothetical protein